MGSPLQSRCRTPSAPRRLSPPAGGLCSTPPAPFRRQELELAASDDEDGDLGRFRRDFTEIAAIAKGQFSAVYGARHTHDGQFYAVKVQRAGASDRFAPVREIAALAAVAASGGSAHVVGYFGSWCEDRRAHLQLELCETSLRSELLSREAPFPGEAVAEVLRQAAAGLHCLHRLGFAHLDVKPENILRKREVWKIADLGLATPLHGRKAGSEVPQGDCRYLAPEVLRGSCLDLARADVFSLGLVCYEMARGLEEMPPNGEQWQRLRRGRGLTAGELPHDLSRELAELVCRMATPEPSERPGCAELVVAEPQEGAKERELQALRKELQEARQAAAQNLDFACQAQKELAASREMHMSIACLGG